MGLSANDAFLDTIAQQARLAYASQQLHVLQTRLQRLQVDAEAGLDAESSSRVRHELTYYTQQIERWQSYLERLVRLDESC